MSLAVWGQNFFHGAAAAVSGSVRAVTDPTLKQAFWRSAKQLFVWSVVLVAIIHVVFLPVEWLLGLFLPQSWIDATLRASRYAMNSGIPFLIVTGARYFNVDLFESAFFAGLGTRDKRLAERMQLRKAIYWDWEYVRHAAVLGLRQALFGLVVVIISPVLGILIPLARFGYKIRRMEVYFWVPIFIAFCFSGTRPAAVQVVRVWMNSRALTRELYDPVIARLKSFAPYDADAEGADAVEWHTDRSDAARLGFAMVIGFFLEIPFIGPFTWFAAFVAAGLMTPELINVDGFKA